MPGAWWSRIRNRLYDKGVLPSSKAFVPVISIGNLTWGGTGKTALVMRAAQLLLAEGYRPAILSRGYGRASKELIEAGGTRDWRKTGDEPQLLARMLPQVPIIVSGDRLAGVEFLKMKNPDVILLDDGFQHRRLQRDLDIVMIDASEDITSLRVIPFGKLREPLDSLLRASAVVLTHAKRLHPATQAWIDKHVAIPVFKMDYEPVSANLAGKPVAAFCGLGAPQHFFAMLQEQGASLVFRREFRDHHAYTKSDLAALQAEAVQSGAECLVTTAKDAVKISDDAFAMPLVVVDAVLKLNDESGFRKLLISCLPARVANIP